jgi:hypothetical protein
MQHRQLVIDVALRLIKSRGLPLFCDENKNATVCMPLYASYVVQIFSYILFCHIVLYSYLGILVFNR